MTDTPQHKSSTTLKVLAIVGVGFLLLILLLAGTCAYCVMSSDVASIVGESVKMGMQAAKAPGAAELRQAGCDQAMVMDMRGLVKKFEEMNKENPDGHINAPKAEWQQATVACQFLGEATLSCDDVAETYVAAVAEPPSQFAVVVQQVGNMPQQRELCSGIYGPDAVRIMDVPRSGFGPPPGVGPAQPFEQPGEGAPGAPAKAPTKRAPAEPEP